MHLVGKKMFQSLPSPHPDFFVFCSDLFASVNLGPGQLAIASLPTARNGPSLGQTGIPPRSLPAAVSRCAPSFRRPPTSAPRTMKRCGPPALSSGYVACLRLSATRGAAPSHSAARGGRNHFPTPHHPPHLQVSLLVWGQCSLLRRCS